VSVLGLNTAGVLGDGCLVSSVGTVDALPPLPLAVAIVAPEQRAHVPAGRNPRFPTPNQDPRLHLLADPACALVEQIAGLVDDARQLAVDVGLRPYEVWSVVVRWSGGERHRGTPSILWEQPFLPVPKVTGVSEVDRDLRAGGAVKRGTIRLEKLSARYTQEQICTLFPSPEQLGRADEHFIETRIDGRDGSRTVRARYVVSGTPERRPLDWTVKLTKQDANRERDGRVQ
jgi:hypothetical protein